MQNITAVHHNNSIFNCIYQVAPAAQEQATITLGRVPSSLVIVKTVPDILPLVLFQTKLRFAGCVTNSRVYMLQCFYIAFCWTQSQAAR